MNDQKTMTVGTVDNAKFAVFADDNGNRYAVPAEELRDWELDEKLGFHAERATGVNLDDSIYDRFYLVYCADCAFPPLAIVRSDNEQDAEEEFIDNLDWAHITDPATLADYDEDSLSYGPSGQTYDGSEIVVRSVKLVSIHC